MQKQAMAFDLSPFDEKLLKFGKLFRERYHGYQRVYPIRAGLWTCAGKRLRNASTLKKR